MLQLRKFANKWLISFFKFQFIYEYYRTEKQVNKQINERSRPIIYHVKLMTVVIQKLRKQLLWQHHNRKNCLKCNIRIFLRYRIERKTGVILRCKLATITNKCQNCHVSVCSKFSRLFFCQILCELVYSWESTQKEKGWTFYWDTVYYKCCDVWGQAPPQIYAWVHEQELSMFWNLLIWKFGRLQYCELQ